jgi:hypothetical protein
MFGLMVQNYDGFKDFSQTSGMMSATPNAAKSAQNLPKIAQNCQNLLKSP